jgi:hypothetical protein
LDLSSIHAAQQNEDDPENEAEEDEFAEEGEVEIVQDLRLKMILEAYLSSDEGEEEQPQSFSTEAVTEYLQDQWFAMTENLDAINDSWSRLFAK